MANTNHTVIIDHDNYKWLALCAHGRRISVSELVAEIVTEFRAGYAENPKVQVVDGDGETD